MASIPRPKIRTSDHTRSSISADFVTGTEIAITYYSNYSHSSRSSSRPIFTALQTPTRTKRCPPHPTKKSSAPHHMVMKSYKHVRLTILETHYHKLIANIKNQDYWILTSNVGIKIQKALNCSTGLKNTGIFSHILGTFSLQNGTK